MAKIALGGSFGIPKPVSPHACSPRERMVIAPQPSSCPTPAIVVGIAVDGRPPGPYGSNDSSVKPSETLSTSCTSN